MSRRAAGRPRDPGIDERILEVARHHLATHGYASMSLVAIAEDAGTTRQALYRRWPSKADLATAAIAAMSRAAERPPTEDAYADLVAELDAFRRGISRPDGVSMVGTMLVDSTDPELVQLYRDRIVAPRRERLRAILERARDAGELDTDADIELATHHAHRQLVRQRAHRASSPAPLGTHGPHARPGGPSAGTRPEPAAPPLERRRRHRRAWSAAMRRPIPAIVSRSSTGRRTSTSDPSPRSSRTAAS